MMSAQFALKLSREGIGLYRREGGVWALAGRAALDDPDLAGALEELRARAAAGTDGAIGTHLILPNSEIRYTEVALGGVAGGEEAATIRAAIDGLTPYAVGELEIDWVRADETARVAVIARETLREAEQFVCARGFSPVSLGAVPPPGAFPRDVDFGAAGGRPQPEADAARAVTATAQATAAEAAAVDAGPGPAEQAREPAPAEPEPPETLADWELDAPLPVGEPERRADGEADSDEATVSPATLLAEADMHDGGDEAPAREAEAPDAGEAPADTGGNEPAAPPPPLTFSSRRAHVGAHAGAHADTAPGDPEMPQLAAEESGAAPVVPPVVEEMPSGEGAPAATGGAEDATPAAETTDEGSERDAAMLDAPSAADDPAGKRGRARAKKGGGRSRRKAGGGGARRGSRSGAGVAADSSPPAPERAPTVITTPVPPPPATEAELLTVFGARRTGRPLAGGRTGLPRRPFVAALAVLLLAGLGVAAVWLLPGRVPDLAGLRPGWLGGGASQQVAALPEGLSDTGQQAGSGAPGGPENSAPAFAPSGGEAIDVADGGGEAGADVAAAAPRSPAAPREGAVGGLFLASVDPEVARPPAPWRPAPRQLKSDTRPARPMPPPPPGQRFELDSRGLVTPSAEGTLSPEGVPVLAGAPAVTAPPRPAAVTRATRNEAGGLTVAPVPPPRPAATPPEATADQSTATPADAEAEVLAEVPDVLLSVTPTARPEAVPEAVRAALEAAEQQRVAAPIPTSASVATRATVNDGLDMGRLSLIGVFGVEGERRALVRLDSGEFVEVSVGDRLDGGRVVAIGQDALRYVRGGRNVRLKLPEGG